MSDASTFFFINLNIEPKERYAMERFLSYENGNHDPLTSNLLFNLKNLERGGQFRVQGQESRPDLISHAIYGETQYWWLIMAYNALTSVEEIVNGMEIVYPRADLLEDFYFGLKLKQDNA